MKQLFRSHRFRWLLIAAGAGLMVGAVALLVLTDNRPAAFGTSSSGAITAARVPAQAAKLLVAAAGPVKITTADLHALG